MVESMDNSWGAATAAVIADRKVRALKFMTYCGLLLQKVTTFWGETRDRRIGLSGLYGKSGFKLIYVVDWMEVLTKRQALPSDLR